MAAKKKTKTGGKATKAKSATSFESAVADLVASAQAMVLAVNTLGLASLTEEERIHSPGRLRTNEATALTAILDTVDAFPQVFGALADKDGGSDPQVVETAPARASLLRAQQLAPLAIVLDSLVGRVSDDLLASVAASKDLTTPAYAIAKVNAASNPKLRRSLATAIDFYAKTSRRTAKSTRAAKGAKPAATNAAS